jgi:ketosteroid isomerase-like protein
MRQWISIFVASSLSWGAAIAEDTSAPQKEIAGLEAAIGQAMIHKDVATVSRLVADDWAAQSDEPGMATKAGFVGDVRSGALIVTAFKQHDLHVRVLGDVAYVQGSDDEVDTYRSKDSSGTYNWLDVWAKRSGHWASLATQITKITLKK